MIDAMVKGVLVQAEESQDGGYAVIRGRIVMEGGQPVQLTARRGAARRILRSLPQGSPVAVAGKLSYMVRYSQDGTPYVALSIAVTAVLAPSVNMPDFETNPANIEAINE